MRTRRRRTFDAAAWLRENAPPPVTPEEFVLDAAAVAMSPLAERLIVAWGNPADAGRIASMLRGYEVNLVLPPTQLFTAGVGRIWADYQFITHMGPALMAGPKEFLTTLRGLTDRLLCAVASDGRPIVEIVPPDPITRALVTSLYPDAVQVEAGSTQLEHLSHRLAKSSPNGVGPSPPTLVREKRRQDTHALFVIGSARSGTTWISRLLQLHPETGGIGDAESWLFELLGPLWRNYAHGGSLASHLGQPEFLTILRGFCDDMFNLALAKNAPDAAVFVEKTPGHAFHLPMMRALYPDAHFVHLVRDGRDVARSLSQMAMAGWPDVGIAAANWKDLLAVVRRYAAGADQLIEVRYEALVADPIGEVCRVWEWSGLPVDSCIRAEIANVAGERVSTWSRPRIPLGSDSWRTLSSWELGRVYAAAGHTLVAEGYLTPGDLRRWKMRPEYLVALLTSPNLSGWFRSRVAEAWLTATTHESGTE